MVGGMVFPVYQDVRESAWRYVKSQKHIVERNVRISANPKDMSGHRWEDMSGYISEIAK